MADLSKNSQGEGAPTGEDAIHQAVENSRNSDESQDDDSDDDSDDGDDDDSDDDSSGDDAAGKGDDGTDDDSDDDADDSDDADDDDAESGDKKDPKSGRKFSQFAGDGSDKAYISNLEEGYKNSSAEAIRIKDELETANGRVDAVMRAVAGNPELSKALNDAVNGAGGSNDGGSGGDENSQVPGADNPFIRNLQSEWQEKSQEEIQEFIDANPEVVTDPQISKDVKHYMKLFSNDHFERTGKLMSGGEAMAKAYKHLGLDDKRGKQDLANGAKKNLTPPRSRGNKAKKSGGQKPAFTADQVAMAKAMGKDEAWLQKNATK